MGNHDLPEKWFSTVSTTTLDSNTIYHVAATFDASQVTLYINGEPSGTGPAID